MTLTLDHYKLGYTVIYHDAGTKNTFLVPVLVAADGTEKRLQGREVVTTPDAPMDNWTDPELAAILSRKLGVKVLVPEPPAPEAEEPAPTEREAS